MFVRRNHRTPSATQRTRNAISSVGTMLTSPPRMPTHTTPPVGDRRTGEPTERARAARSATPGTRRATSASYRSDPEDNRTVMPRSGQPNPPTMPGCVGSGPEDGDGDVGDHQECEQGR